MRLRIRHRQRASEVARTAERSEALREQIDEALADIDAATRRLRSANPNDPTEDS